MTLANDHPAAFDGGAVSGVSVGILAGVDREDTVGTVVGGTVGITVGDAARFVEEAITSVGGGNGVEISPGVGGMAVVDKEGVRVGVRVGKRLIITMGLEFGWVRLQARMNTSRIINTKKDCDFGCLLGFEQLKLTTRTECESFRKSLRKSEFRI